MLGEYLEEREELVPNDPLFLTQQGTPLTPYAVWYAVKKYAWLAEVEDVKPHSFRHTVVTRLVRDPEVDLVTAATFWVTSPFPLCRDCGTILPATETTPAEPAAGRPST